TQSGAISAGLLTTTSVGGTILNIGNTVSSFHATNGGGGDIALTNTAATLTITGISQSGNGTTTVLNTGDLATNGLVATTGNGLITLQASGSVGVGADITAGLADVTLNAGSDIS